MPLTIMALLYGGAMLVNIAWPRPATNPTPDETGLLLDFGWGWLNGLPVFWTVVITITLVGAIYFALFQRRKPTHLEAPEGQAWLFAASSRSWRPPQQRYARVQR